MNHIVLDPLTIYIYIYIYIYKILFIVQSCMIGSCLFIVDWHTHIGLLYVLTSNTTSSY